MTIYDSIPDTRALDILRIGHKGDGETAEGIYVPFTVPGDRVKVEVEGDRGKLINIISPGPSRTKPPCKHFTICGGCVLQHLEADAYREWKRDQIVQALAQRGIANVDIAPLVTIPPRTRRRAVLTAKLVEGAVMIGFQERGSHHIVDMAECHVLHPDLFALVAKLRVALAPVLPEHARAEIDVMRGDNGIDMSIGVGRLALDGALRTRLATFAATLGLARLTINGELIAQSHAPVIRWAGAEVTPPPGSFLQAVPEAERALQDLVVEGVGPAKRTADLFSGCGTFAFALAQRSAVAAFDSEADAIAALTAAARNAKGLKPITAERRDLFRRPLQPRELDAFDAAIIDPPRAGAKAQSEQLALSKVRRIVAVSCAPATFARDARILIDGGYTLTRVTPIDQFLWTPHIELAALFERK
ncbi:MAG: class I SAM-dependent RNA methyltransferase [Alphaproteobacteria bacterium]|nr:class I SAM-dependent RNA methyltransferase [Alphaproteobacteria bacterium]